MLKPQFPNSQKKYPIRTMIAESVFLDNYKSCNLTAKSIFRNIKIVILLLYVKISRGYRSIRDQMFIKILFLEYLIFVNVAT